MTATSGHAQLESLGVLLIVDGDLVVRHVSAHCGALLGVPRERIIDAPITELLAAGDVEGLRGALDGGVDSVGWRRVRLASGGAMKLHMFDPGAGLIGVDLLPLPPDLPNPDAQAVERVAGWSGRLLAGETSAELLDTTASIVRELTGFGGVWVSRLEPEGHSTLVAADVDGAAPSVGQSVRPGDAMPGQPVFRGRPVPFFVADLAAEATRLTPEPPSGLDINGSLLLRPYPQFLEKMMNLGVRSIASIPILIGRETWGRIIALHPSALRVPAATQAELSLLGVAAGARLNEVLELESARERTRLSQCSNRVVQAIAGGDDLLEGLTRDDGALLGVCAAHGAIVDIAGHTATVGDLDPAAAAHLITVARSELRATEPLIYTSTLHEQTPLHSRRAAGYLAVRLDQQADDIIIWTRGETSTNRTWIAPQVVGDAEQEQLFAGNTTTTEPVQGACAPWTTSQQQQATELREAIGEILVARYTKVQTLNAQLTRSNEEYDAFAHAAAHDLKAPLRGIRQNIEFALEDAGHQLDPGVSEQLNTAIRLAGRMSSMLDDLMAYAQAAQTHEDPHAVELTDAVADATELLGSRADQATISTQPATLNIDPPALRQLLLNLIGNAVKYTDGPAHIEICVTTLGQASQVSTLPSTLSQASESTPVLVVADHGIGIDAAHHERIFGLYRQLNTQSEGSGTGLALCRLICRRHNGDIWLTSIPGHGTTFYAAPNQTR